jgi:NADH-quinone oxidoreductase subunit H
MTFAEIVVILLKIVVAVAFLLTGAAVSVWADRRQGGLVQDRIGPTRAVVFLPRIVAQAVLFGASVAAAAFIIVGLPWLGPEQAKGAVYLQHLLGRMTVAAEIFVLVLWFSLMALCAHVRKHGAVNGFEDGLGKVDPRTFFFLGIVLHLVAFPLVRMIPWKQWDMAATVAEVAAGIMLMAAAGYAGVKIPEGKVGIRLFGLIHPVADTLKMMFKEEYRPKTADKLLHSLGPILALFPALVTFAVVPFGSTLCFTDTDKNGSLDFADLIALSDSVGRDGVCRATEISVPLAVADLNVGLLFIFAIAGTGIVGAAVSGWASDNKFALLGGLRATSQMVSYEVALGLTIVGMLLVTSTVHLGTLVDWQGTYAWGIFVQPLGFLLFLAASIAETKRVPFDLPEGESEIVCGYFLEYSSTKFGMFFIGEYVEFAFATAMFVVLFLGGYHVPFLYADGFHVTIGQTQLFDLQLSHLTVTLIHVAAFFGKVFFVGWLHVFIRWTLPRFRYDQVMDIGWKKLLPLALVNILLTGAVVLAIDGAGESVAGAMKWLADVTQAIVAVGALVLLVAFISWLVEPARPPRFLRSTAARFAAAGGGTKIERMGA